MIARESGLAPNSQLGGNTAPVGTFKNFTSVAMPGDGHTVWFTATLRHGAGITAANDSGLWIWSANFGTRLILRKGADIAPFRTQKVVSFKALDAVPGSPGHGRYGDGFVGVQVSLDDGTDSAFNIMAFNGDIENDISSGPPPSPTGPWAIKFGEPNWRQAQTVPAVLLAMLDGPGVTPASNQAIIDSPSIIARTGTATGLPRNSVFKTFKDPVTGLDQDDFPVDAFHATLSGGSTTTANDSSLWWWHGAAPALSLLAREGGSAPGGGTWKGFTSLTTLPARGPAFTASLAPDNSKITNTNDSGLWAINSAGVLRKLFREGDVIEGKTLLTFNVLGVVAGSPGQRRAWSETGNPAFIWRGFFSDGSSAIIKTTVP
jgi:hypothetical protein